MSFTAITNDTSWQDLAIATEIAAAYDKRRTACGMSLYGIPTNDVKVRDFIYAMQSGIEEMAVKFGNYDDVLDGQSTLPQNWTVAAAMTKAGLTNAGYWRRIPNGSHSPADAFSYGKIQAKDEAGPWLFQDIETALAALRRRYGYATDAGDASVKAQYTDGDGDPYTNGHKIFQFPDDYPISGLVDLTPIDSANMGVSAGFGCWKINYPPPPVQDVDVVECQYDLAKFRVECGVNVTGTSRTVTFIGIARGNHIAGSYMPYVGQTASMDVTTIAGSARYFAHWFPRSPTDSWGKSWAAIAALVDDGDVAEGATVSKYCTIDAADVATCTDYVFVDGPEE